MGRKYQGCVAVDLAGYSRVATGGAVRVGDLAGYEFVTPAVKGGELHSRVPGQSTCFSRIRKVGGEHFLELHPRSSRTTSTNLHYWSLSIRLGDRYNDHLCYARVAAWALDLHILDASRVFARRSSQYRADFHEFSMKHHDF